MTSATLPLVPETAAAASGTGACAAPSITSKNRLLSARSQAVHRAVVSDVDTWLRHVESATGCSRPIQLHGTSSSVNSSTGEIISTSSTSHMPDGVIYKACGNRRASECPSCAETYRRDAFELVRTGLIGGKEVSNTVAKHPAIFVTLTAPGFGVVHTRRTDRKSGRVLPCRPRRVADVCPHGVDLRCHRTHADGEKTLGNPLCLDCYNYDGQVAWNHSSGELWRRTRINIDRALARICSQHGLDTKSFKLRYVKVSEFQARGVVHFHVVIRLDGAMPKDWGDPGIILAPPHQLGIDQLTQAVDTAAQRTAFTTRPHTEHPNGWHIAWGRQLDIRPIDVSGDDDMTDSKVAGYLAKYSTKDTEATGHHSRRLTNENVELFADPDGDHIQRLIDACWQLGKDSEWHGLRRWAHRLGFSGHPYTKARAYSVTFGHLRHIRTQWKRAHLRDLAAEAHDDTITLVNHLEYTATGWRTDGDALLAQTAADLARRRHQIAKEELAHELETTGTI